MALDPSQFSVAPGDMRSLQDRMLELRKQLPPEIAAKQAQIPGMPQQTQPQQQEMDINQELQKGMRFLAERGTQREMERTQAQGGQAGMQPNVPPTGIINGGPAMPSGVPVNEKALAKKANKSIEERLNQMDEILDGFNPLKQKKLYGVDLFGEGQGGILGTGVTPLQVLMGAIGIGATWNLPQQQAQATTAGFFNFPETMRDKQLSNIKDVLGIHQGMGNLQNTAAQVGINQAKAQQEQQQNEFILPLAMEFFKQGKVKEGLAILADRANKVDLDPATGGDKLPSQMEMVLSGIVSGALPIPESLAKQGVTKDNVVQWFDRYLQTRQPQITPEGQVIGRTPQGPAEILNIPKVVPGQQPATQQPSATPPATVPGGPSGMQGLPDQPRIVLPGFGGPQSASPTATQQPTGQPGSPEAVVSNLEQAVRQIDPNTPALPRSLDVTTKAKMLANLSTMRYTQELAPLYDAMVTSYGGDAKFSPKIRAALYGIATAPIVTTEGGMIASGMQQAGRFVGMLLQEGFEPTPEAEAFISKYTQAQRFAKGALQDAANLAVAERARFDNFLASVLDRPSLARKKYDDFYHESAADYNKTLDVNKRAFTGGFPLAPLQLRKQAATSSGVIELQGGKLPPGAIKVPRQEGTY